MLKETPKKLELIAIDNTTSFDEAMRKLLGALYRAGIPVKLDPNSRFRQDGKPRSTIERLVEEEGLTKEQAVRAISDTLL